MLHKIAGGKAAPGTALIRRCTASPLQDATRVDRNALCSDRLRQPPRSNKYPDCQANLVHLTPLCDGVTNKPSSQLAAVFWSSPVAIVGRRRNNCKRLSCPDCVCLICAGMRQSLSQCTNCGRGEPASGQFRPIPAGCLTSSSRSSRRRSARPALSTQRQPRRFRFRFLKIRV